VNHGPEPAPVLVTPPTEGAPLPERLHALLDLARTTKGFMPDDEGLALYETAVRAGRRSTECPRDATFVEIGAWCGKSTIYLGAAAEATNAVLFSVDHHHGSEENQSGWEHHDPEVVDPVTEEIDTLAFWRRAVDGAGLGSSVVGVVGDSPTIASRWQTPLDLCFIDGGHGEKPAWEDFHGWAPLVAVGKWLAIHDVFPDPSLGGRPPYELWRAALESGQFVEDGECGSLRVLRRVGASPVRGPHSPQQTQPALRGRRPQESTPPGTDRRSVSSRTARRPRG
jgi:MMP 1-O-methyltransferase